MPASSYQDTFDTTSLTAPGTVVLTVKAVEGASSNSQLPPTTGQLWPRIIQR
jgi:hypothetical protein